MTSFIARKGPCSISRSPSSSHPQNGEPWRRARSEVLDLLVKGFTYKEIASELAISYSTVQTYIQRIYEKLHVQSRSHAVAKYLGA